MNISYKLLIKFIRHHKKTLLLIVATMLVTVLLQTLISIWLSRNNTVYLPSIGTIYTFHAEVYGNDIKELSDGQKLIDWGIVYPGSVVTKTFNVTSESNAKAILVIKPMNWVFNNSRGEIVEGPVNKTDYMTLSANFNGTLMSPGQTSEVKLTLMVSNSHEFINFLIENHVTVFSFDIYVYMSKPD